MSIYASYSTVRGLEEESVDGGRGEEEEKKGEGKGR